MNYFYFAKKGNFLAGYINLIISFLWVLLIFLLFYYHFCVLLAGTNTSEHYKSIKAFISDSTSSGSGPWYPQTFIAQNGYKKFFALKFFYIITYWHLFITIYVVLIILMVLLLLISLFTFISSIKAKSMIYIYLSCVTLFLPFFGAFVAIKFGNKTRKIITTKAFLPGQWIRFKFKTIVNSFISDPQTKNF